MSTEPGHYAEVNYFDLIETNTELGKRLLDVLQPPLRLGKHQRPWPQEWQHFFSGPGYEGVMLKISITSAGMTVRLTTGEGQPLRLVAWPFSDQAIDPETELP